MTSRMTDPASDSIHARAQQLGRALHELQGLLRAQRNVLRQRGMTLPSEVLTLLEDAQIGVQTAIAVFKEEEETLRQFQALTQTAALINSTLKLDQVLEQAMETVIELTGAERGYLMLRNKQTGELEVRVARNLDQDSLSQEAFVVSRSVINQVAQTGTPVVTTNAQSDPRFASQESIVAFALRSILCVPLKLKEEVIGVIYADNRVRSGLFGESELAILNAFASQAAVAIENARMFEQISAALSEINEIRDLMDDVFASIPSGVVVTDSNNQIQAFNISAQDILALPESPDSPALQDYLHRLGENIIRTIETVRRNNHRIDTELIADVPSRGQRYLQLKLSPLQNPATTQTDGVAIVVDDLTEQRRHEAQLNVVRRYLPPAMVDNIQSIAQLGLGGVRRDITVMYIDVQPAESDPDALSPVEQMTRLNAYMSVASEIIHARGGIVDKYMGTEIMVLFNTQLNPSDTHEWDAIQAALEIIKALPRAEQMTSSPEVSIRIGMHSGIATMGNVGSINRREFTAIGDTVNLAHRLLDMAGDQQILASQDVVDPVRDHLETIVPPIDIIDRGAHEIRGRKQAVQIYQLIRHTV